MLIVSNLFKSNILQHLIDENNLLEQCAAIDSHKIIPQHLELTLEYEIYVASLLRVLKLYKNQSEIRLTDELIDALETARKMAIFLAVLYQNYLSVSRISVQLRKDEEIIRNLLNKSINQHLLSNPWGEDQEVTTDWFTRKLRELVLTVNLARLLTFRGRKLLTALRNIIEEIPFQYNSLLNRLEMLVNPILLYIAWIFYIPRLMNNLYLLFKHFLPHPWMSKEEESLGATIRLRVTMQRRWFELVGDAIWFTAGILSCFLLIGSLMPVAIYLGVGLYLFDLILASARAYIELSRLVKLRRDFSIADPIMVMHNQEDLELRTAYEKRRLYTTVAGSVGLLISIGLTIPLLAAMSPILPIIGAGLLIAITLVVYLKLRNNEKTKPATKLSELSAFSFFKVPVIQNDSEANVLLGNVY